MALENDQMFECFSTVSALVRPKFALRGCVPAAHVQIRAPQSHTKELEEAVLEQKRGS